MTFERSLQIDSTGALHTNNYDREIIMGSTSSNSAPYVTVNGGTITTNNGSLTFTNKAASLGTLSFRQSDSTISGKVLATGFRTEVNGNLNFDGSGTLESAVYQQTGGAITGANGLIRTTDATQTSTISGPGTVFNTNANFAGNVEFTNGATLKGGMRTITGSNAKTMLVDDTSLIDLSTSDLEVRGFKSLILDGALRVGHDNVDANRLILSNSTQLQGSVSRALELDSSFNQYYYGKDFSGTDVVVQGGTSQSWQQEDWTISNAFGKFDFGYRNGNYALVKFETSNLNDVDEVRENLNRNWDGNVVSRGFAQTIAEVAKTSIGVANGAAVVPTNNPYYEAGLVNRDILEAFAHGHSTFSTDSDTDVSGSLDRAMLAMYNDSNQTGVVQVSVDVSRDIVNTLHSRLDAFRRYLVAIDPATGSEVALGNTILHDDRYFNRVWAGVLGSRMNADKRKGFEGYKYKGEGGIIGYDRGFGAALLGFSAAYIQGDYEDKSAIAHDSDIENYAFDVYGTYNFSNGFYTTVNAGYTRSRNKINELRGNNWAREKYHTDSWRAGLKIGYDIMVSDTFFVSPSLGVDAYYARSNRHHASIDDIFLVEYGRMKTHGVEIPFDVKLSKDIVINNCSTVTLMANGGYAYNLHDKGIRGDLRVNGLRGANVGPYKAEGRKLGHHSWNAGAGVRFRYNEWEFAAKYDFHGRKGYTDHRLMGQIGFNF
ncbi:MAG: autotransporter outer membrane beta-barrel domain-containing protein [Planctomycetes bacterium]|nr:autotransporter outer membrane beta-barrel domain-containing protein [Planctomycetota bacterium]